MSTTTRRSPSWCGITISSRTWAVPRQPCQARSPVTSSACEEAPVGQDRRRPPDLPWPAARWKVRRLLQSGVSYTSGMINGRRAGVVLPAYNAATTLARTLAELDREVIDEIVLVDDASTDQTVPVARELGLEPISHELNRGYGGNQKTCYRRVLELGADIIVMVHPDYQYSPLLVPAMASMIAYGEYDLVLGSRILAQNSVARGMPRYKYVANRFLTLVENVFLQQKLSEYHTGLRAFSSTLLAALPFERNSDDFVFDNQIIAQAISVGARIGEVSCPTRYETDSSSINLSRSIQYGVGVLRTCGQYQLHKHGLRRYSFLDLEPGAVQARLPSAAAATPEPEVRDSAHADG